MGEGEPVLMVQTSEEHWLARLGTARLGTARLGTVVFTLRHHSSLFCSFHLTPPLDLPGSTAQALLMLTFNLSYWYIWTSDLQYGNVPFAPIGHTGYCSPK